MIKVINNKTNEIKDLNEMGYISLKDLSKMNQEELKKKGIEFLK